MLKRTELRQMVCRLLRNKTAAQHRVHDSLPFPIADDECPCILVYTPQDNAQSRAKHTALLESTLTISIEVRVAQDYATAAAATDDLVERIEQLILGSDEFQGAIEGINSVNTQMGYPDGGDTSFCVAILTISVDYKRSIEPIIDDRFLAATVNLDAVDPFDPNRAANGPDGRIESTVDILVPQ